MFDSNRSEREPETAYVRNCNVAIPRLDISGIEMSWLTINPEKRYS
jgi:hypothetical protein